MEPLWTIALKESGRRGGSHERRYLAAAARLAEYGYVGGVAAERLDVVVHPLQCGHQIQKTRIARRCVLLSEVREVEEAQHVETVVERYDHRIALAGEVGAVVRGELLPAARSVTAAVQPDHDGALLAVGQRRSPDVDPQTVLAGMSVVPVECERVLVALPASAHGLRTCRPVCAAAAYALPLLGSLRRHEPLGAGVGYALEYI